MHTCSLLEKEFQEIEIDKADRQGFFFPLPRLFVYVWGRDWEREGVRKEVERERLDFEIDVSIR